MNIFIKGDTMSKDQATRLAEVLNAYANECPYEPVMLCSSNENGNLAFLDLANGVTIVSDYRSGVIYTAQKDEGIALYDNYELALERQNQTL